MKITDFLIDGFGIFSGINVPDLSPGLNVFCGDNEAGKSTLLAFFRAMFFGFESGAGKNPYKPIRGGRHGGILTVEHGSGRELYRIERIPGKAAGNVVVHASGRDMEGEEAIATMLPGVTKGLYRSVFAFSLDELVDKSTKEFSDRVYSYGAGAGQVSAIDVDRQLANEMESLFNPRAKTGRQINDAITTLQNATKRSHELSARSKDYSHLKSSIESLEKEIDQLEAQISTLRQRESNLQKHESAWENWVKLAAKRAELTTIPEIATFPDNGAMRLTQLIEKRDDIKLRLTQSQSRLKAEQQRLEILNIDQALLDSQPEIEQAVKELEHFASSMRDLPQRQSEAQLAQETLLRELRNLGEDWTEERINKFDSSFPVLDATRKWAERLKSIHQAADHARLTRENAQNELNDRQLALTDAESQLNAAHTGEGKTIEELEQALSKIRTAIYQIDSATLRLGALQTEKTGIEAQQDALRSTINQQKTPLVGLSLAIAAISLAGAGILYKNPATAAAVGGSGLVVAIAIWLADRSNKARELSQLKGTKSKLLGLESRLSEIAHETTIANQEIADLKAAISSNSSIIGHNVTSVSDLNAAESRIAGIRNAQAGIQTVRDRITDRRTAVKRAEDKLRQTAEAESKANSTADAAESEWSTWLESHGLPTTLSPDSALDFLSRTDVARSKSEAARSATDRADSTAQYIQNFEQKANELLAKCRRPVPTPEQLASAIIALSADLSQSISNATARIEVDSAVGNLKRESDALQSELEAANNELSKLLQSGGAADEEDFRQRSSQYERRIALLRDAQELESSIKLVAGEDVAAQLAATDLIEIKRELAEAADELTELTQRAASLRETYGGMKTELSNLEKSDELSTALMEVETTTTKIETLSSQWAVRAIGRELLKRAREHYEREKQPRVVQAASEFMKKITQDTYQGVFSPLGSQEVQLEASSGGRKNADILSRGTREQLYLSLRFGLIREYGRNAEPLPVIMDDILVNFDPIRTRTTAEAILELAKENQVLFFTCHPETSDQFAQLDKSIKSFRIADGSITPTYISL